MAEAPQKFLATMTVGEAMALHPRAREIFMAYHLGGCSHCAISEVETIEQVCWGYGVPVDELLATLNSLLETRPKPVLSEVERPAAAAPSAPKK